jgi:uncharacterized membrane protein YbhN (UPF0104 family)
MGISVPAGASGDTAVVSSPRRISALKLPLIGAQLFTTVVPLFANVAGDLWHWLVGVFKRIGDVSIYWLVLALALKTAESALIGLTWRNILRAAYPRTVLSFKTAWGASQGGTALNAVAPAQAGTAAMIGIFRAGIPGSTVAGLASATIVQSLFFTVVSVLMVIALAFVRPGTVSRGSPSNESGGFFAAHPVLIPVVAIVVVAVVVIYWPRLKPRLLGLWHGVKEGAAIFRDRRRYVTAVALPSGASFCCRIGVNTVFMAAFAVPITSFTVLLVASSHMLSQLFAITPGGVGQTQALDVATLRKYASPDAVAAFSITQDAVITLWNVVLGLAVMMWAFGYGQLKGILFRSRKPAQPDRTP